MDAAVNSLYKFFFGERLLDEIAGEGEAPAIAFAHGTAADEEAAFTVKGEAPGLIGAV